MNNTQDIFTAYKSMLLENNNTPVISRDDPRYQAVTNKMKMVNDKIVPQIEQLPVPNSLEDMVGNILFRYKDYETIPAASISDIVRLDSIDSESDKIKGEMLQYPEQESHRGKWGFERSRIMRGLNRYYKVMTPDQYKSLKPLIDEIKQLEVERATLQDQIDSAPGGMHDQISKLGSPKPGSYKSNY